MVLVFIALLYTKHCLVVRVYWPANLFIITSRIYGIAQYAKAGTKVNRRVQNLRPTPSEQLHQFWYRLKYITTSTQGVDVHNLV